MLITVHLKKRGFQMVNKCPLCGKVDEEPNLLPFDLGVVGGPHLYPGSVPTR